MQMFHVIFITYILLTYIAVFIKSIIIVQHTTPSPFHGVAVVIP